MESAHDTQAFAQSDAGLEGCLMKRSIDIANIISLVTSDEIREAAAQTNVKFAEETTAQMNMIAFD